MAPNQPLFSRRQLNLIIAITAVVIALLSIPTEPWPAIERQQLQQVSLSAIADTDQPTQLRLLFALPRPGLLPTDSALLVTRLLEQRLQASNDSIATTLHGDRISLSIRLSSTVQPDQGWEAQLHRLTALLLNPFDSARIEGAIKQLRAQRHLSRNQHSPLQQADRWLRQQPTTAPLSTTEILQLQQQLFSRSQLRLSLTGSAPQALSNSLNAWLQQLPEGLQWPSTNTSITTPLALDTATPGADTPTAVPALQPLAGRQSIQFPQTLLMSRIIEQLSPRIHIRLYPAATTSWLIGLPTATTPPQWLLTEITQILQQLATMPDWELEHAADQLREQLEQRLHQPAAVADQLEAIAFYALPVDYLPQFDATIAALTGAQIRQQLLELLQPERFYAASNR